MTGAGRWRNPDDDLPKDFEANRAENYQALRKPLDPATFIGELREEMETELAALHEALPALDWLQIKERKNGGAIILTPLEAAPEPRNLRRLKAAVKARWGTVPLLDMLAETALRTGCLNAFTPAGTRSDIDPAVLFPRLLLLRLRDQRRDRRRGGRRARPHRGRPALRTPPVLHRRGLPRGGPRDRQRHVRVPAGVAVGSGNHRGRLRLHPLHRLRPEHLHRMAFPL